MPFNILCDAQNSGGSDKHAVETKCGCRGSVEGSPAAPLELCCHAQATHISQYRHSDKSSELACRPLGVLWDVAAH